MAKPTKSANEAPSTFTLLLAVRDAQSTKGAQRALLNALIFRANPDKSFMCWPSYRLLAEDTQLDEGTLKRAAKALQEAGLIRRVIRRQRSNQFYVRFDVLIRQAEFKREEKKLVQAEALRKLMDGEDSNLGIEVVPDPDKATDSDLDEEFGSWGQEVANA